MNVFEQLHRLCSQLRLEGKNQDCFDLAQIGKNYCQNLKEMLLLDYEQSICGFYLDKEKHEQGHFSCENIINHKDIVDGHVYDNTLRNQLYYIQNIPGKMIPISVQEYVEESFIENIPSIVAYKDIIIMVVRCVNYKSSIGYYPRISHSKNLLFSFHLKDDEIRDLKFLGEVVPNKEFQEMIDPKKHIQDIEDIRLYIVDGILFGMGTCFATKNILGQMIVCKIGQVEELLERDGKDIVLEKQNFVDYDKHLYQKNWAPIGDTHKFLYSYDPMTLVSLDQNGQVKHVEKVEGERRPNFKGSTQYVKVDDLYYGIIHECRMVENVRSCVNRFVMMDGKGGYKYTKLFYLKHIGVEYVAGMVYKDGNFYLSCSYKECSIYLLKVPLSWVVENTIERAESPEGKMFLFTDQNKIIPCETKRLFILPKGLRDFYNSNGIPEKSLIDESVNYCSKNSIFLDIGAHTGTYSINLAEHCKEVYAFEPQRSTYYGLCGGVALSGLNNVTCMNVAIGSKEQEGEILLRIPDEIGGGSSIVETKLKVFREEKVKVITLDSLNLTGISLIKMDVEGNELDVIKGGIETLHRNNYPRILFECNAIENEKDLFKILEDLGYQIRVSKDYTHMFWGIHN